MVQIDFKNGSYICPFCGHAQAYGNSHQEIQNGFSAYRSPISEKYMESSFLIHSFECRNSQCGRIAVSAINRTSGKQLDIVPQVTMKHYPEYIPAQIRNDYYEANMIIESSPKASATLLRRCLQGMIHDFWGIHGKNLNAEITALNGKIPVAQWSAINGLRKLGNIGAHMESDVNLIIDIEADEARKLLRLIELLMDKWYIARHDEEELCAEIIGIADEKTAQRKC